MSNTPHTGEMTKRPFGPTGLLVTPICIGCAELGNMVDTFAYEVPEERALATVRAAFSGPFNFLDTAALYGDGESERRIGLVLREIGGVPAGYILATKADRDAHSGDFSGAQMERSIERSLRLLGLSRLQYVYLHDPEYTDYETIMAPGGALEVLQRLHREGVIEHLGVAGGPVDLLIRYVETGAFSAVITHNRYTLLNRTAAPLLDVASRLDLAVVNAAPYGSGLLAKGPSAYPRYAYRDAPATIVESARRMEELCGRYGVPLAAAALQFSLRDPRITVTIVGMSRPERLAQTAALAQHPIPDELWSQLDAVAPAMGDPQARQ